MIYKARDLAKRLECELVGDPDVSIGGIGSPGSPPGPGDLVVAFTPGAERAVAGKPVAAVLVEASQERPEGPRCYLVSRRGRVAFALLLQLFDPGRHVPRGLHPSAVVDPSAEIGEDAAIGPLSVVGPGAVIGARSRLLSQVTVGRGAVLGEDCLLYPGARIGEDVVLGRAVVVQANAVVGAEGFSYVSREPNAIELAKPMDGAARTQNGPVIRMPPLGTVVLEDEVEIGANTAIDRATLGATRIGARSKIDNLVQIGHNCQVGSDCLMSGQSGLSGSVTLGDRAVVGGKAGIADHRKVGTNAMIAAGTGLGNDVADNEIWIGYPAGRKDKKIEEWMSIARLPRMIRDILDLRKRLGALETALAGKDKEKA
ncbi:MAG: UDP-3-O-(3-hydroxymyristoyl)glucosamine N-acyltransferase [Rhodospirillales bacterium]|nr:UDP-3-O-(3-hydroxymyristoyl)glucosamine N-acyltransferase [Rhodospirillales bacterium]